MTNPEHKHRMAVFRLDASVSVGSGHLFRCLCLADSLRNERVHAHFICRNLPDNFAALISQRGHQLTRLAGPNAERQSGAHSSWLGVTSEQDAADTADAMNRRSVDWLVVDHYAIDAQWESLMRPFARRILVVDDLADRRHDCDVLLDQNWYLDMAGRYAGLLRADCRQLLGPRYALLRPEFAELRDATSGRDGTVRRVLVFFGGADANDHTSSALEALFEVAGASLDVDVVIGAMNPHAARVEAMCASQPRTRVFRQTGEIATLMAKADLSIGAGGTATWERCCLGLPALVAVIADNQRRVVNDLSELGALMQADAAGFAAAIATALHSPAMLRGMSRRSQELVDGRGVQRVVAAMLAGDIVLRAANREDCDRIYEWRNHPAVRSRSRNAAPIEYSTHLDWYARALDDSRRVLLVAETDGVGIGVMRFDVADDAIAEVSIFLAPERLSGGWGAEMLERAAGWMRHHRPEVRAIDAEILADNLASLGAFKRAGYRETSVKLTRILQ